MPVDIVVPPLGESITKATLARWLSRTGDAVAASQPVAELQTATITEELLAPAAGVLTAELVSAGATVRVGEVVARMNPSGP